MILRAGVLACLLLVISAVAQARRIVLLVTHPRAAELENFEMLAGRGLLRVPGLRIIGIYSSQDWDDYKDARRYVNGRAPTWIRLKKISCELSADNVFGKNDCNPRFKKLFNESAGVVFTGGPDIPPALYGQKTLLTTVIKDPPRHWFEISFLHHLLGGRRGEKITPLLARRPAYLVLGLCLGMQSINVATGGSLVQDIPSQTYGIKTFEDGLHLPAGKLHRSLATALYPADDAVWAVVHPIKLNSATQLAKTLLPGGGSVSVLSLHHQAIAELGSGLEVWATSEDGKVIEAIRHSVYQGVIGVQFHPEKKILFEAGRAGNDPAGRIAAWFARDTKAQAFEQAFWKLVSEKILTSERNRAGRHR